MERVASELTSQSRGLASTGDDREFGVPSIELSAWERFSFTTARTTLYLLARVLSLAGLYRIGRIFGVLEWAIDFRRRSRLRRQMIRLLGTHASTRVIRSAVIRHFVRLRCDKMFYLIMDRLPRDEVRQRLNIVNREVLDDALMKGRGAYLALSHFGSLHLTIGMLVETGYKIAGIRAAKFGAVWRFVQSKLEEKGRPRIEYFQSNTFPRPIYRRLNNNVVVASLADVHVVRDGKQKTVEVELFGERREILTGPFQIAIRCGSPIVQATVRSLSDFRYEIELNSLLPDPSASNTEDMLADAIRAYASHVEQFGSLYPCHISRY